jgi:hypothetical protein
VKAGAPLALVVLGVIALAGWAAVREEETGTAWDEGGAEDGQAPPHTPVSES